MEDCKSDLSIALSWAVSAKNYLKSVNGFSPNQLVFGSNPNLPNNIDSKLPAHEGKPSSKIVAKNLNAMHSVWKALLKVNLMKTLDMHSVIRPKFLMIQNI